jgi:hypothetical protein
MKSKGYRQGDLPAKGLPNSWQEKRDENNTLLQRRYYGVDGHAQLNVDYGHDHAGTGDPHAHDWNWKLRPPRQPPRRLTLEEHHLQLQSSLSDIEDPSQEVDDNGDI